MGKESVPDRCEGTYIISAYEVARNGSKEIEFSPMTVTRDGFWPERH